MPTNVYEVHAKSRHENRVNVLLTFEAETVADAVGLAEKYVARVWSASPDDVAFAARRFW